jgi:hypothetical protein
MQHVTIYSPFTFLVENDVLHFPLVSGQGSCIRVHLERFRELTLEVKHLAPVIIDNIAALKINFDNTLRN